MEIYSNTTQELREENDALKRELETAKKRDAQNRDKFQALAVAIEQQNAVKLRKDEQLQRLNQQHRSIQHGSSRSRCLS